MNKTHRFYSILITFVLTALGLALNAAPVSADCGGDVICVDADATGAATGLSWTDAFTNVQDALAVTNANGATDYEIWVAEGVYYPDVGVGTIADSPTMSFTIRYDNVRLYGGFTGGETALDQRDWKANVTILSGDIDGNDWNTDTNHIAEVYSDMVGANAYHVVHFDSTTHESITLKTLIDGFVVTAGTATALDYPQHMGGGIRCHSHGSGHECSPRLTHLIVSGNQAFRGGGMVCAGTDSGQCNPVLRDVIFSGNAAMNGGGILVMGYDYNAPPGETHPTLIDVSFRDNFANNGGGMSSFEGNPTLIGVTFRSNEAHASAGLSCDQNSTVNLTNVTFSGNLASLYGGGLNCREHSAVNLTNVTFGGNYASESGGGLAVNDCAITLTNSILWGNAAGGQEGHQIDAAGSTTITLRHTLISQASHAVDTDGVALVVYGPGVLTSDPHYVAPVAATAAPTVTGNYRLQAASPAIDAGDNTAAGLDGISYDLDGPGNPRFWDMPNADTGIGSAPLVDMGAYEAPWILRVDADATGQETGLSWTDAHAHLQDVLDFANANGGTDIEVWVAEGVYYPDEGTGHAEDDTGEMFALHYNNVQLYGGFAATETARTQRDWTAHATILSGDLAQDDANSDGNAIAETWQDVVGDNATRILWLDGASHEAITDYTVIDGFTLTAGEAGTHNGGGIYCDGSDYACTPRLTHLTFSGNRATHGGGLFNDGSPGQSNPTLTDVTFTGNRADQSGGGLFNYASWDGESSPALTHIIFSGNQAIYGGGLFNYASWDGESSPALTNVLFHGNYATHSGGGMASESAWHGISQPALTNVTLSSNHAVEGGGGLANKSLWGGTSSPLLTNAILWGNTADTGGAQMHNLAATPALSYTLIQSATGDIYNDGSSAITYGPAILTSNPIFVAPIAATTGPTTTGDYHVQAGSPAIDAGDNTAGGLAGITTDLDGGARILNGAVDLGPYEFGNPVARGMIHLASAKPESLIARAAAVPSPATPVPVARGRARAVFAAAQPGVPAAPAAGVIYVDHAATGNNDGSSWDDAYTDLQDALAVAIAGDEVWVAAGVYVPTLGADRTISFTLAPGVACYGGFAGVEAARNQRNWEANATILSGDIGGDDVNADGNFIAETYTDQVGDNAYHVLWLDGASGVPITETTVLDGFIITAGDATTETVPPMFWPHRMGGGLYCDGQGSGQACNPTLTHLVFSGNQATYGGGLHYNQRIEGEASPILTYVTFQGNHAYDGGGMASLGLRIDDDAPGQSRPRLTHVTFKNNTASNGGGMFIFFDGAGGYSAPVLTDVVFINNEATYGGGIYCRVSNQAACSPELNTVVFRANDASDSGGGMALLAESSGESNPTLTHVLFSGNRANDGNGGAIRSRLGSETSGNTLKLTNVTIAGNLAKGRGGGIFFSGNNNSNQTLLTNVVLWGNLALDEQETGQLGHQLYNQRSTTVLSHTLIQTSTHAIENYDGGTITYGDGLVTTAPQFVVPITATAAPTTAGNYRLQPTSPAIDAGFNAANALIGVTTDLDGPGNPRFWDMPNADTGTGNAPLVDIGAYEAPWVLHVADADKSLVDNATGLNWMDAFTNVQDALDIANTHGQADIEIWVAEGVYYPDEGAGRADNDPGAAFTLLYNNVQLYGGFAATETYRTQRDWARHPTILSGDLTQDDVNSDSNFIAESGGDIVGTNARHVLWLDGTVNEPITNPTVIDGFTITAGQAQGDHPHNAGGGLYCDGSGHECSPTLTRLIFSGNRANYGGGLFNYGLRGVSSPALNDVAFNGNWATSGGGLFNYGERGVSDPTLVNVTFDSNQATDSGGGMLNTSAWYGESNPSLSNIVFDGNQAGYSGGALYDYGAWYGESSSGLTNVTISGNQAAYGGGLYAYVDGYGTSQSALTNVILWGNAATISGTQLYNGHATPSLSYTLAESGADAIYNDAGTVTYGAGNLNADPLFVDAAAGDLRPEHDSPAVDAGDNLAMTLPTDIASNPRIVNGTVDMGAYEAWGSILKLRKAAHVPYYYGAVRYILTLTNVGVFSDTVTLTDTLPGGVLFGGWIVSPTGTLRAGQAITWTGVISAGESISLTFTATHTGDYGDTITNTAYASSTRQHLSVAAAFTVPQQYTLTARTTGAGGGSVASDPPGIACGADCTASYADGTRVILTATPLLSSTFSGWIGAVTTTNPITLTVDAPQTVTATFALKTYVITPTAGTGGSINPAAPQVVDYGDDITFTITPDANYHVADVWVDEVSQGALESYTFENVTASHTLRAAFALDEHTLAVDVIGQGAVTRVPSQTTYLYGDVVTLTATADPGWTFAGWSGGLGTTRKITLTLTSDTIITATFTQDAYMLDVVTVGNGDVALDPEQDTYHYGDMITLTATPDDGWYFGQWSGDAGGILTQTQVMMDGDKVVTATFLSTPPTYYTLTLSIVGNGVITPAAGTHSYLAGTPVDLYANPETDWQFVGWTGDLESTVTPGQVTLDTDKAITATFTPVQVATYTLAVNTVGHGSVTRVPSQTIYLHGDVVTLTAAPDDGWYFGQWLGDAGGILAQTHVTMDGDKVVTATFLSTPPTYYTLTLGIVGNGVITPAAGTHNYLAGTPVDLCASPETDWRFQGWWGDLESTLNSAQVTMDADKVITATFALSATANTPPTLSSIADQTTFIGVPVGPLALTIGDAETPATELTLTGTSSNPLLVPTAHIVFSGSGADRAVTITPTLGLSGTVMLAITVSDGELDANRSFALTVVPHQIYLPLVHRK